MTEKGYYVHFEASLSLGESPLSGWLHPDFRVYLSDYGEANEEKVIKASTEMLRQAFAAARSQMKV